MSNLNDLIAAAALELRDEGNAQWSAEELTGHLRRALRVYNRVAPQRLAGMLATVSGEREVALSALGAVGQVLDVWFPWNNADPDYPPARPAWSLPADGVLRLEVAEPPVGDGTDDVRVFYTAPHTIEGLDGESVTTLDAEGEDLAALGATGYAALAAALGAVGAVTVSSWTPRQYLEWGLERLKTFRLGLDALRDRLAHAQDARVSWA